MLLAAVGYLRRRRLVLIPRTLQVFLRVIATRGKAQRLRLFRPPLTEPMGLSSSSAYDIAVSVASRGLGGTAPPAGLCEQKEKRAGKSCPLGIFGFRA